ncbi:uncharacterized protein [Pyrus communis]|uniref:uncharacterized protein n=1 Tax=Pyrus communis TaxID=23211 RepID=UPI0035C1F323
MSSSRRVHKQFVEQQKRLLAQQKELINLEEGGGGDEAFAMEKDSDDDHRRQMASHSHRVMEAVGLLPEQKTTVTLRMLAYGAFADQVDEIARMGKTTVLESLMQFCSVIEALYTNEYLRTPTPRDMRRLLRKVPHPQTEKEKYFAKCQEGCRKDVERCFGILQARWAIVRSAARMFDVEALRSIMMTCIIFHNMIMEDESDYDVVDEYELDLMNNSRTCIYCAHDRTEDPVQHEPLEQDGR